jgi:hypothetical protein
MSELSLMVRSAIKDLYGSGRNSDRSGHTTSQESALQRVVQSVASLDSRILKWYGSLPGRLKLGQLNDQPLQNLTEQRSTRNKATEELEDHIFQLQALTLKLAYENARILIHRPLLSYKFTDGQKNSSEAEIPPSSFQSSIQACRSAALQVSRLESAPIFNQVSETYAVAYVSLHLLTAGIALCIMTNLNTLSVESHESKVAVHRLMGMQHKLKSKSIVAAQGLDILGQLMSLVMTKEMDKMFEFVPERQANTEPSTGSQTKRQQTHLPGDSIVTCPTRPSERMRDSTSNAVSDVEAEDETARPASPRISEEELVSQTLHDLEQGRDRGKHALRNDADAGIAMMGADEHSSFDATMNFGLGDFGIVGQDQGWIWGSDYGL